MIVKNVWWIRHKCRNQVTNPECICLKTGIKHSEFIKYRGLNIVVKIVLNEAPWIKKNVFYKYHPEIELKTRNFFKF